MPPDGHKTVTVPEGVHETLSEISHDNEALWQVIKRLTDAEAATDVEYELDRLAELVERVPERTADELAGRFR